MKRAWIVFLVLWLVVGGLGLRVAQAGTQPPEVWGVTLNWFPSQNYDFSSVPILTLRAVVDDFATGGSNVSGANYTVGPYNWPGTPMNASDGFFDWVTENVTATIPNPGTSGSWSYCVYGWDAGGNYNTTSTACADLTIVDDVSPVITSVALDGVQNLTIPQGTSSVVVSATSSDSGMGDSSIASADYNTSWGDSGSMFPTDGAFDGVTEDVNATLSTSALAIGSYTVCVYSADDDGNPAGPSCTSLTVSQAPDTQAPEIGSALLNGATSQTYSLSSVPILTLTAIIYDLATGGSNVSGANYTVGLFNWPGIPMTATDGSFDGVFENVTATIPNPGTAGSWNYCVYGWDEIPNYNTTSAECASLNILDDMSPTITSVFLNGVSDLTITSGTPSVVLSASLTDVASGNSIIANASYRTSWATSGIMFPTDGAFDESTEAVNATLSTGSLIAGPYIVCVYGADDDANLAGPSCANLTVSPAPDTLAPQISGVLLNGLTSQVYGLSAVPPLTLTAIIHDDSTGGSNISGANYTIGPASWPGIPMGATDGIFDEVTENVIATIPNPGMTGSWSYCVYGWDEIPNYNTTSAECASLNILDDVSPIITSVTLNGLSSLAIVSGAPSVVLNATLDDSAMGNSDIQNASYSASWGATGPLSLVNPPTSPVEDYTVSLSTASLSAGFYLACVYGADDDANLAGPSCADLTVSTPPDTQAPEIGSILLNGATSLTYGLSSFPLVNLTAVVDDSSTGGSNVSGANYTVGLFNWPGIPMTATDGSFDGVFENVTATIPNPGMIGSWSYCVYGWDEIPNHNTTSTECATLTLFDDLPPIITSIALDGVQNRIIPFGTPFSVVSATLNDGAMGNSNIANASYSTSWGTSDIMSPMDGAFDGATEDVNATVPTSALASGTYSVYVYGMDTSANLAGPSCANLTVLPPPDTQAPEISALTLVPDTVLVSSPPPTVLLTATIDDTGTGSSLISLAVYTLDDGPSTNMTAEDGTLNETIESVTADIPVPTAIGQHVICVYGSDSEGNDNTTGLCITLTVADDVDPIAEFTVSPEEPTVDEEVTLDAADSSDAHSSIASYSWVILDPELNEHTLTGETAVFTPAQVGEYTIILNVSDEWDNWANKQVTLTVKSLPKADMLVLQMAGAIGVGVGIVLLAVALLLYRTPPAEALLARMKEIEPFDLTEYKDVPVSVAGVVAAGDHERVLADTRNAVMENARLSERRDAWAESSAEVSEDA